MFTTNWSVVWIFIIASVLLCLIAAVTYIFYIEFAIWIKRRLGELIANSHRLHRKYRILIDIFNHLRANELSYSIDIIFQLFVRFYETNQTDMEHWGFDKELFPNGRKDISDMYRWIKKIRPDNYAEATNLIKSNENIVYWGSIYKSFKFRVNLKGEIIIIPVDDIRKFHYERSMNKLQNVLYALDTEKCNWILERRKFFGF